MTTLKPTAKQTGPGMYTGYVVVLGNGPRYSLSTHIVRLTRADALLDASIMAADIEASAAGIAATIREALKG